MDLYRGELLPGFYDDWVLLERERLAALHRRVLCTLVKLHVQRGRTVDARAAALHAVTLYPVAEDTRRSLIETLTALGDVEGARRAYEVLQNVLEQEHGTGPSPETLPVAQSLAVPTVERAAPVFPRDAAPAAPAPLTGGGNRSHGSAGSAPGETGAAPRGPEPTNPEPINVGTAPVLLPSALSRFFGREAEIERLCTLLNEESTSRFRLVTLVGPGGVGKTRLSVEAARAMAGRPASRFIAFVSLEELADASSIGVELARAFGLRLNADQNPLDAAIETLNAYPASLLILDNFEHLVERGTAVVLTLLTRSPDLTCVVTSRRRLALPGEHLITVDPFVVPEHEDLLGLLRFPGIQMFVDRAQAARPDFQLTARNASQVLALYRHLEGMPLSIELAAAWSMAFTPGQILERLSQSSSLLARRRGDKTSRRRSLEATIDWSYRLLPPDLQQFFQGLCVFRGGITVEAALAVFESDAWPSPGSTRILDWLVQLRERSLLVTSEHEGELRFQLFESIREFLRGHLRGRELEGFEARHAGYFLRQVEIACPRVSQTPPAAGLKAIETQVDNIRAAMRWCALDESRLTMGLRFCSAMSHFWMQRGGISEGIAWLESAVERSVTGAGGIPPGVEAELLSQMAQLYMLRSNYPVAARFAGESLAKWRLAGDETGIARALLQVGAVRLREGDYTSARPIYEECLAIYRRYDAPLNLVTVLINLGQALMGLGEAEHAERCLQEALVVNRRHGDPHREAWVLLTLGVLQQSRGELEDARKTWTESLEICRREENRFGEALLLVNLGALAQEERDYALAARLFDESLKLRNALDDHQGIASVRASQGDLAMAQEDYQLALDRYHECLAIRQGLSDSSGSATALVRLAHLALAKGETEEAARLLAAADRLAGDSYAADAAEKSLREQCLTRVRASLRPSAFKAAWTSGSNTPPLDFTKLSR
ncbi:MAG: tetratricopeptide repeat protein [Chloroflexi bacterium]|nr:tetratricopeptide repeat protein [Chloroflexota bacterium]